MVQRYQGNDSLEQIMQRVLFSLEEFANIVRTTHGLGEVELIPVRSEQNTKTTT